MTDVDDITVIGTAKKPSKQDRKEKDKKKGELGNSNKDKQEKHTEDLLDEGLEESFPASDPPSIKQNR